MNAPQGLRRLALICRALVAPTIAQQQPPKPPVFRSSRVLVSVDVVVRDSQGNIVKGLKADDFEVREDGRPQDVQTFSFQEIAEVEVKPIETAALLAGVEEKGGAGSARRQKPRPSR